MRGKGVSEFLLSASLSQFSQGASLKKFSYLLTCDLVRRNERSVKGFDYPSWPFQQARMTLTFLIAVAKTRAIPSGLEDNTSGAAEEAGWWRWNREQAWGGWINTRKGVLFGLAAATKC